MHKNIIENILHKKRLSCMSYMIYPMTTLYYLFLAICFAFQFMDIYSKAFGGKTVLEIGPYRTATAFLFKQLGATKIRIIDGDIPDLDIMQKIYETEKIDFYQV